MIGWAISLGILVGCFSTPHADDPLMFVASAIFAFVGAFSLKTFK